MEVIHLISGGDSGGAKTHVLSLLQGLNPAVRADLVCFREGAFTQQARELNLNVRVLSGKNPLSLLLHLTRLIRQGGYDLVHCHGTRANVMGALLRIMLRIPVATTVHSDPRQDYLGRPLSRLVLGTLNALALRYLEFHIGVSESMVDLLVSRGIVKKHFYSIYNGISFSRPLPSVSQEDCRRQFGLPTDGCTVVGIAARLDPVKDLSTLLRGFAEAHRRCPNLHLLLAGDGPERDPLAELAETLNIADRVTFCGWVDDMDCFYRALDINVLTSRSETFPYSLTEGSRHRLASVASAVGGIPDLIENGTTGFLFPAGDWETLAAHLIRLTEDSSLRHELGSNLHEKAETHFSLEQTIQTQIQIYQKMLRPRASKRVLLCGSYGRGNAGDETILTSILDELRSTEPDLPLCVMSRSPRNTRSCHRVESVHSFFFFSWRRRMIPGTLFLQGGGSLLQNVTSRRSLWFYLTTLWVARRHGCKVMLYGCGIGPVKGRIDRRLTAWILNRCVDVISLRDPRSLEELRRIGVTRPSMVVAADPALHPAVPLRLKMETVPELEPNGRYMGIILRSWPGFQKKAAVLAAAVEQFCLEQRLTPVFIPMLPADDLRAARQVTFHLKSLPSLTLSACPPPAFFRQLTLVVSMRLHGLIFAVSAGVSIAGIAYDPKIQSFLEQIDPGLCLPLEATETDSLLALFRRALIPTESRQANMHTLLLRERVNIQLARRLLYDSNHRGES